MVACAKGFDVRMMLRSEHIDRTCRLLGFTKQVERAPAFEIAKIGAMDPVAKQVRQVRIEPTGNVEAFLRRVRRQVIAAPSRGRATLSER